MDVPWQVQHVIALSPFYQLHRMAVGLLPIHMVPAALHPDDVLLQMDILGLETHRQYPIDYIFLLCNAWHDMADIPLL